MVNIFKILTVFLVLLCLLTNPVFASQGPEFKVDHITNGLEKLSEKITLFFKFSKEDKINYQQYLVEKRLAELRYVLENKQNNLIEETASRYMTYLNNFSNALISENAKFKKDDVTNMLESHKTIIENLQKNYEYDSGWWLAIQHDVNTIKNILDKLKS